MEDTYYFSQGRMTYNKFKEPPRDIETGLMAIDATAATAANATKTANGTSNGTSSRSNGAIAYLSKLWNFQLYNKSILRYKL